MTPLNSTSLREIFQEAYLLLLFEKNYSIFSKLFLALPQK